MSRKKSQEYSFSGHDAMHHSMTVVRRCGGKAYDVEIANFGEWYNYVVDLVAENWTQKQFADPRNQAWALAFRKLYDDFEAEVQKDPAILYQPINPVSDAFHKSQAYIRYYRAGNRTSKTQSGYLDDYWTLTGQHPYRDTVPGTVFIVAGLSFTDYLPKVFTKKMFDGEGPNPLAPLFPRNGKWFNHYDERKHVLTVACPECAEAGKAQQCPSHHRKQYLFVFGVENGPKVLEGFAAKKFHIDESVPRDFFYAGLQRLASVPQSHVIITATPLTGPDSWENKELTPIAEGPKHLNKADADDSESPPYVELFSISQWDANVAPHSTIRAAAKTMDKAEYEVRIMGRPAPLAKNPVFPLETLDALIDEVQTPIYISLQRAEGVSIVDLAKSDQVIAEMVQPDKVSDWTGLRVWERPQDDAVYLVGVDTSAGLSAKSRDPSCANVFKLIRKDGKIYYELVASFHGWITVLDYAEQCKLLATWYHNAFMVIETTGGYGRAVLAHLQRQLFYPFLYRDLKSAERLNSTRDAVDVTFGLDTNVSTKPAMIGALTQIFKDKRILVRDQAALQEFRAYEQTKTVKGTIRYEAASGSHDDRVMATAMVAYVLETNPLYFDMLENMRQSMVSSSKMPSLYNDLEVDM